MYICALGEELHPAGLGLHGLGHDLDDAVIYIYIYVHVYIYIYT